jgi:hypothetical protein
MKQFVCLLLSCWCGAHFTIAQTTHVLIVAISHYPEHSDWTDIHADNDVKALLSVLPSKGVKKSDIQLLENSKATKQAIVGALTDLRNRVKQGDRVYIHFSAHGQQMEDNDGDEPDGLDEAMVPYDAEMFYKEGHYVGENHLRDDELDVHLTALRQRAGKTGQVILALDACHSGSGSRGAANNCVRGTDVVFSKSVMRRPSAQQQPVQSLRHLPDGASLTVMSACRSYQSNFEHKADGVFYGALTFALCEALRKTSFEDVFLLIRTVKNEMNKISNRQNPVMETTEQ